MPGAHVPVPLGEPPEQAAEADGHGLLEVAPLPKLGRGRRRRRLLPLLGLVRVVDYDVTVWKGGSNGELTTSGETKLEHFFNLPNGVP